ncbi:MAG: hypothetical protein U0U66_09030 [Cytophagaceae bacterium]
MKTKKEKLEVDVIGGLGALTTSEEEALNAYFKMKKKKFNKTLPFKNKKSTKVSI